MQFEVPITKDPGFAGLLLETLSDQLIALKEETGKWPDQVVFGGPIGKELFSFIEERAWDLKKFGPTHEGIVNKIVFGYSKPLDQIEDRGGTVFDERLHGKRVNGIPGPETIAKIVSTYAAPAFVIQRQVRPKREIILIRKRHE
jgi:hypothetical protein